MGASSNFTIEEVEAIRAELFNIQQSLSTGEQEKVELMKNLACLKDDLTRLQPTSSGQVRRFFYFLVNFYF
jgi:protein KIBRA